MSNAKLKYNFLISGGGTGGHIFPALSIANALTDLLGKEYTNILFIGAKGKIENKLVPEAGFPIRSLSIIGLPRNKNIFKLFQFVVLTFKSLFFVNKWIKQFKPHAIIGVGGYASFPTVFMGQKRGIPSFIQEQNAFVGIVNKTLAPKVKCVFGGYEEIKGLPKCNFLYTGNPVRENIKTANTIKQSVAIRSFQLSTDKKTILIMGGSQGASTINKAVLNIVEKLSTQNIQLIWQTGALNYDNIKQALKASKSIHLTPFIHDMANAYAASDIIISRSGALASAELSIIGKPSILIPLSTAAENHQLFNAKILSSKQAAILIQEQDLDKQLLVEINNLVNDNNKQKQLSNNIKKFAKLDADTIIAKKIIETINLS